MRRNKKKVLRLLQKLVWDYQKDPQELYAVLEGRRQRIFHFDEEKILLRMLKRLSWYDILEIVGIEKIKQRLTRELIGKLRNADLREKYERVRKILQREPLPVSGWDPEYRERIMATLLSDRWYRTEPALFSA